MAADQETSTGDDSYPLALDSKPAWYAQLLRALPAGLTEWAVHPTTSSPKSRVIWP